MSRDPELLAEWARHYLVATTRERMGWINTRCNDLQRILSGVKRSARYVLDHEGDIDELDRAIRSLERRLAHLRRHVAAVEAVRKQD